jgi:hypothetical protein
MTANKAAISDLNPTNDQLTIFNPQTGEVGVGPDADIVTDTNAVPSVHEAGVENAPSPHLRAHGAPDRRRKRRAIEGRYLA